MSYVGLPNIVEYDYLIYKDSYDANKIKARNGKTAQVQFNHATDAGNVINSCINALPNGGVIELAAGTFNLASTILITSNIHLKGTGRASIIKLADSANVDGIKSSDFDTQTGENEMAGIEKVRLSDFTLDGNRDNNTTGYGIRKYGWGWRVNNVDIKYWSEDGIYSEFSNDAGSPNNDENGIDMWSNCKIYRNDGRGVTWRGPHDSELTNLIVYANLLDGLYFQIAGALYAGNACVLTSCHSFANGGSAAGYQLVFDNCDGEATDFVCTGASDSSGDIRITGTGGRLYANGVWTRIAPVGILIDGGATGSHIQRLISSDHLTGDAAGVLLDDVDGNYIEGRFNNNTVGVLVKGTSDDNYISAICSANTTGIKLGDGTNACNNNYINANLYGNTTTHFNWGTSTNANNLVTGKIRTFTSQVGVAGTIDHSTNIFNVKCNGSGKNYQIGNPKSIFPSQGKKWGLWSGASSTGADGILANGFTNSATAGSTQTVEVSADGRGTRYVSGTTTDNVGGIRTAFRPSMRSWNPILRVRFRLNTTSLVRQYIGFTSNVSTDINGDDELNAKSGISLASRSADTNWFIASNDGSGATVFTATSVAKDTNIHLLEIIADNANSKWICRIDNGANIDVTSDIPASTTALGIVAQVQTNESAVAKTLDIFYIELEQDK